jgi:hypothetical protein
MNRSVGADPGAERDIDLASWLAAVRARIWIVVATVVVGGVIGAFYSVSGGGVYKATAYIAPGQAFSPSGTTTVLTYLTSAVAINELALSTPSLEFAAARAKMSVSELRGHVNTSAVNQATGASSSAAATRNAVLISITVQLSRAKRAEDAANAIAQYIATQTTSSYVLQSVKIFDVRLANYQARIVTLQGRIADLRAVLNKPGNLAPLDRLVLATELDEAEGALGATNDSITLTQQGKILANDVEKTQIVQRARPERSTARSRRNSILVGLLIGLLAGAMVAVVVEKRSLVFRRA